MFSVPYLISAFSSPFLGFAIDRIGKRALVIVISSVILTAAYSISMVLPECDQCYHEMYPLVLTGIGYSIYAAAIWGSVPYVVTPQTVGTAFGICTAIQNIGLTIAPTIVGFIKDRTGGYYWVMAFFVGINLIGFVLNICLYFVDINQMDGVLNKVDRTDRIEELITSPPPNVSRKDILKQSLAKSRTAQGLVDYKLDSSARESLRRSMATKRPY